MILLLFLICLLFGCSQPKFAEENPRIYHIENKNYYIQYKKDAFSTAFLGGISGSEGKIRIGFAWMSGNRLAECKVEKELWCTTRKGTPSRFADIVRNMAQLLLATQAEDPYYSPRRWKRTNYKDKKIGFWNEKTAENIVFISE